MTANIDELEKRMAAAATALDFEEARRLRDEINLIRGGADPEVAARTDTSVLSRQRTEAMGIGTSKPTPVTPPGWTAPRKPDPMTTNRSKRR